MAALMADSRAKLTVDMKDGHLAALQADWMAVQLGDHVAANWAAVPVERRVARLADSKAVSRVGWMALLMALWMAV